MIGHFESLVVIMSSPRAKNVNKPILSLKNMLAIWCDTLDLLFYVNRSSLSQLGKAAESPIVPHPRFSCYNVTDILIM